MTTAQRNLYFALWNEVCTLLKRQGLSAKEADAKRHELHLEALGYLRSSKKFTNAELDKVFAHFKAILQPWNLNAQTDALDQPRKRHLAKLEITLKQLQRPREYAEAIARRMHSEGKMSSADLDTMALEDLRKIIAALVYQLGGSKRPSRKKAAEGNIQHPTSNIQWPLSLRARIPTGAYETRGKRPIAQAGFQLRRRRVERI
jgi:hypothetical protein